MVAGRNSFKIDFAGGTRLAVRTNGTLSYLLGDHIGSSSVTTNANGAKTATALYKAFGETRYTLGNLGTDYKFTGQRLQAELGIYWFQSRWYDGSLGRFTSPDTIVPTSTQGTQAWDRYAYVNNNPVRYNDPTGHQCEEDADGNCIPGDPPQKTYCEDPQASNYGAEGSCTYMAPAKDNTVDAIKTVATVTQDIATGIDGVFALAELGFGVAGCAEFLWVGCVEGAATGMLAVDIAYQLTGANALETVFSGISLLATVTADFMDDGQLSDDSLTSAVTFGTGAAMPDALGDFVIDGYASGYNHGIFSGIGALFNGAPFFTWP